MRAYDGADAVDGILVAFKVGTKGGVHCFLKCRIAFRDGDDFGTEDFHTGDVGRLFGDVDGSHVYFTFQSEEGGSCCQGNAVLPGSRFGNKFLFSHVFGQKSFSHAVVKLVSARVVEVLALEVELARTQQAGEAFAMVDRRRTSLELAPDAAQFVDELGGMADGLVGLRNFLKGGKEFRWEVHASVFAKIAVFVREVAQVGIEIDVHVVCY